MYSILAPSHTLSNIISPLAVDQLPLYLHRNFTLMNELDRQSRGMQSSMYPLDRPLIYLQAYSSKLLPTLREYVKMRRDVLLRGEGLARTSDVPVDKGSANGNPVPISSSVSCSPSSSSSLSIHRGGVTSNYGLIDTFTHDIGEGELRVAQRLPTISLLADNLLHASEEKVNLAKATYDSAST